METICESRYCTGCMACGNVCPKEAIEFTVDEEGFVRPVIDPKLCIDCGLCERTCPVNHDPESNEPIDAYSGWAVDEGTRMASSSGGVFTVLARQVLDNGGVVYGAAFDESLNVCHIRVDSSNELARVRGSKYVQSYIGNVFKEIKKLLDANKTVLFSGTPCQVGGLRNFIRKSYANLITVDIACHGVPSPKVFSDWRKWLMEKHSLDKIDSINFRAKEKSWFYYNISVKGTRRNNKPFVYKGKFHSDTWIRGFLSDNFLRPCCYSCGYTKIDRSSDITLADCWGYRPEPSDTNDYEKKGVSLILCNTPLGRQLLDQSEKNLVMRKKDIRSMTRHNPPFNHPSELPISRKSFWEDYKRLSFEQLCEKYIKKKKVTVIDMIRLALPPSKLRDFIMKASHKLGFRQ